MKLRRRWIRRLLLGLATPILIVILFFAEEAARGWWELRTEKAKLRAAGVKLEPDELVTIRTAPSESANRLMTAAGSIKMPTKSKLWSLDAPRMMIIRVPGKALVGFQQVAMLFSEYVSPKKKLQISWEDAGEHSEKLRPALLNMQSALEEPVLFTIDYNKGPLVNLPDDADLLLKLSPSLTIQALYQLHSGHLPEAASSVVAMVRLPNVLADMRSLVTTALSGGWANLTWPVVWEALQADGWNDADLAKMQAALEEGNSVRSAVEAAEMDLAQVSDFFSIARGSRNDPITKGNANNYEANKNYNSVVIRPFVWRLFWSQMEEARVLRDLAQGVSEAKDLLLTRNWQSNPLKQERVWEKSHALDRWRLLLSEIMNDRGIVGVMMKNAVILETKRSLFVTGIALKRYHLIHDHHPDHLAELVPDFLQAERVDWMNGEPLHYRRNADDTFSLYSVGNDGVDNGGDPTAVDPSKGRGLSIDAGRDMVFPSVDQG